MLGKGGINNITKTADTDDGSLDISKSPIKIEKWSEKVVLDDIVLLNDLYTKIGIKMY